MRVPLATQILLHEYAVAARRDRRNMQRDLGNEAWAELQLRRMAEQVMQYGEPVNIIDADGRNVPNPALLVAAPRGGGTKGGAMPRLVRAAITSPAAAAAGTSSVVKRNKAPPLPLVVHCVAVVGRRWLQAQRVVAMETIARRRVLAEYATAATWLHAAVSLHLARAISATRGRHQLRACQAEFEAALTNALLAQLEGRLRDTAALDILRDLRERRWPALLAATQAAAMRLLAEKRNALQSIVTRMHTSVDVQNRVNGWLWQDDRDTVYI
jgi:hypothetical protein